MLAIRLDEDLEKRLAALAARTGRTKTYYAREAIKVHMEEMETISSPKSGYATFGPTTEYPSTN